jgi:3-hydroxyacyl-[acyl-carrier-protein] dehydratase
MRFCLIDRIASFEPGVRLRAVKAVALAEEYLSDHFPSFPVLPGVFMLEALTQAGAWLVRLSDDFAHSMIVLQEARNIKYADFVSPGASLQIEVEILSVEGPLVRLKGWGEIDGRSAVSGRLTLRRFNLADEGPEKAHSDREIIRRFRELKSILMATAAR